MSKASISDGTNIVQMPADVVAGFLTGEHEPKSERLEIRFSKNQMAALAYVAERLGEQGIQAFRAAGRGGILPG